MICIISLIVFSIMGIFSASHRKLAKEAFNCVFKKATLRKCDTGLDTRVKAKIVAAFSKKNKAIGKFIYRYFEVFSWLFVIIFFISLFYLILGAYNYWEYGNCNGPGKGGFCIYDPAGSVGGVSLERGECKDPDLLKLAINESKINKSIFPIIKEGDKNKEIFFIGCYACPYTRKAYPVLKKLFEKENARVRFAHYASKKGTEYINKYLECLPKNKIMEFNNKMFSLQEKQVYNETIVKQIALEYNKNIENCTSLNSTLENIKTKNKELEKGGIYATPTVFINRKTFIGYYPYRIYARAL